MIIYNEKNVGKLYLSPYLKFAWDDRGVTLYQTLAHSAVRIEAEKMWLEQFFDLLHEGMTKEEFYQEFNKMFVKADAELFLLECIGKGVIE